MTYFHFIFSLWINDRFIDPNAAGFLLLLLVWFDWEGHHFHSVFFHRRRSSSSLFGYPNVTSFSPESASFIHFLFRFLNFFGYLFFLFLTTTGNFQYFLFIKLKWCSNQKEKEKLTDWKIKHSGSFCYSFFVTTYFVYLVLYKVCYGKIFSFSHFFLLVVVNRKEKLHFTWTRHTLMAIMAILIKPWSVCVWYAQEK